MATSTRRLGEWIQRHQEKLWWLHSFYALPLGLRETLQHRWYLDGRLVCASPFYNVVGGREPGFDFGPPVRSKPSPAVRD